MTHGQFDEWVGMRVHMSEAKYSSGLRNQYPETGKKSTCILTSVYDSIS